MPYPFIQAMCQEASTKGLDQYVSHTYIKHSCFHYKINKYVSF